MKYSTLEIDSNLELRQVSVDEAADMLALVDKNREYFAEWLPFARNENYRTVESYEEFLGEQSNTIGDKQFRFGIYEQETLIGHIALFNLDSEGKSPEIGYWISESSSGKGVVTRAVERIVEFAFNQLDIFEVVINTKPENIASIRVAEKAGFEFKGLHDHEEEGETHHYVYTKEVWNERKT